MPTDRRSFLKGAATASAALIVGFRPDGAVAAEDTGAAFNPFVRIAPDGVVHVMLKHFEMGQGTATGLATLVAEELDADWDRVAVEFAPADNARYKNLFFGAQGTGGSTAIANSFQQYRKAGAAARDMLIAAAAASWNVPAASITIERSTLRSGGRTADFGAMVAQARTVTPPRDPALKKPADFRLIGTEGLPRKDTPDKITGKAVYAIDVKRPGMVTAVLLRAPRFGGLLTGVDAEAAKAVPGFVGAKPLPTKTAVAVFAETTWAALQARDAITATWDFSRAETRSTDALADYHRRLLDAPTYQARPGADFAATESALQQADRVIEADYIFPLLAHAPMEPVNCVIEPTATGVRLYDGCQFPGGVQPAVAQVLGLRPADVVIETLYAGGSFGRRATQRADDTVEAAMAFALLGGKTPLKMMSSREDDIRGGFYRPMAAHRARIGLKDGAITGWDHRLASKPILQPRGIDSTSVEGLADTHYALPAFSVGLTHARTPIPVLWWRSVGHTHTAFAMETLIDRAAEALQTDPVAFRLRLLADGDADQRRLSAVLRLAAEKAGWGRPGPGRFQGVALHKSFNTYVAEVVELSLQDGRVKLEQVTCAVDCGIAVNPDVIRAQMEGSIGYGLGAVMRNKVTLSDGEVDQSNFTDYEPLRIHEMPKVAVHIVPSAEAPTGVGEPGVPPVGPALTNAIHAATGKRITRLPMTDSGIEFA